jgi:hypothetical protein
MLSGLLQQEIIVFLRSKTLMVRLVYISRFITRDKLLATPRAFVFPLMASELVHRFVLWDCSTVICAAEDKKFVQNFNGRA